ncbi:MAG TPA: hypothetical protein ENN17_02145 [bacterium]|mgnify:CR=1 FL=1|nr:hypothetical protein [bacterium]
MPENLVEDFITRRKKRISPGERRLSRFLLFCEDVVKVPLFGCQRCGECILSSTALVCCQRCPKRLRNGPCGGTRDNGRCEVYPERNCVWFLIHKRSRMMRRVSALRAIQKIHNWELEGTSAWLNVFTRRIEPPVLFLRKSKKESGVRS